MAARTEPARKASKPHTKPVAERVEENKDERAFQRKADAILGFLGDGLPHTRAEIGEFADKHGISGSELGRIKSVYAIRHVRIQQGAENGLGRSVFAWIIEKA